MYSDPNQTFHLAFSQITSFFIAQKWTVGISHTTFGITQPFYGYDYIDITIDNFDVYVAYKEVTS